MNGKFLIVCLVLFAGCGPSVGFIGTEPSLQGLTGPTGTCYCPSEDETDEGDGVDRAWICHKGRSLQLPVQAAINHLNNHKQDYEGPCQ